MDNEVIRMENNEFIYNVKFYINEKKILIEINRINKREFTTKTFCKKIHLDNKDDFKEDSKLRKVADNEEEFVEFLKDGFNQNKIHIQDSDEIIVLKIEFIIGYTEYIDEIFMLDLEEIIFQSSSSFKDKVVNFGSKNFVRIEEPHIIGYNNINTNMVNPIMNENYSKDDSNIYKNDDQKFNTNNNPNINPNSNPDNNINKENIKTVNFVLYKVISDNKNSAHCLILLEDKRLCCCSFDRSIKFYSPDDYNLIKSIDNAHTSDIYYICQLSNKNIASSSKDQTIKIWNPVSYKLECLIDKAHTNDIIKVIPITKNRFCSCSGDHLIKVWDEKSYKEIRKLIGHSGTCISILQLKNGLLVSGSCYHHRDEGDYTIRLWDLNSYKEVFKKEKVITKYANSLIEHKNKLYVGSEVKGEINIFKILEKSLELFQTIKNNSRIGKTYNFLPLRNEDLLIGDGEGYINILNIKGENSKVKLACARTRIHTGRIYSLTKISEDTIATASQDFQIRIFKIPES